MITLAGAQVAQITAGDLVLNIWPKLQGFHWAASLLSEVLEWELTQRGGLISLLSSRVGTVASFLDGQR
jgi:hypothetical protein